MPLSIDRTIDYCLSVFSDTTTWHESNHHLIPLQPTNQSSRTTLFIYLFIYLLPVRYFKNCMRRHGRNAQTFSALAACALMRADVRDFSAQRTPEQLKHLRRAMKLLSAAVEMSSNPLETTMRLDVAQNIFVRQHRPLLTRKIKFDGLKMVGYKAWHMLHPLHQQQLNDHLRLDVDIAKCGEFVVVTAHLNELPLSLQKLKSARQSNSIPHMHVKIDAEGWSEAKGVDLAPKFAPYSQEYTTFMKGIKKGKEEGEALAEPLRAPLLKSPEVQSLLLGDGGTSGGSGMPSMSRNESDNTHFTHDTHGDEDTGFELTQEEQEEKRLLKEAAAERKRIRLEEEAKPELDVPAVLVRPLVLHSKEVELLLELAVSFTAKERMVSPEEVRILLYYSILLPFFSCL
jgi:hypothetical protein